MLKTMMNFTDPQIKWLRENSTRLGITVSELVRRIIDEKRLKKD